jgi:hypothetical protein
VVWEPDPPPAAPAREEVPEAGSESDFLRAEPVSPPAPAHAGRRAAYRRLAALRRALRAWEQLGPVFGTPTEQLATPVAVLLCVRALAAARAALPAVADLTGSPEAPGGTVAALVRLPHAPHAVRLLLPGQRQAVARDWRRGHAALVRERARVREAARGGRARRGVVGRLWGELRRTPEWALGALAVAALLVALLRRNPGH